LEAKKLHQKIQYVGVEAYPVSVPELQGMNYVEELEALEYESVFDKMHSDVWEQLNVIDEEFCLTKDNNF